MRKEILEKLTWIKGVEAWVELIGDREQDADGTPSAATGPEPSQADLTPVIGVNEPVPLLVPGPLTANPATPARASRANHGRVLINVPRSFYYNHMLPRAEEREPTREELFGMAARTRDQIEKLVKIVVPESWTVDVFTIPDDVPLGRQADFSRGQRAAKSDGLGDRCGGRGGGRPGDGAGVLDPGRAPAGTIARAGGPRPAVSGRLRRRAQPLGVGSASSSDATPRRPPASSSAGPRREDASHDHDPAGVLIPRAARAGGGTGGQRACRGRFVGDP